MRSLKKIIFNRNSWLLVSDVDGTLTTEISIWEYFHKLLNKWTSEGLPNLNAYLAGEITYNEFAEMDALAYKGLSRNQLDAMARKVPRRLGLEPMIKRMKKRGAVIALVSSGLDILVDQIPGSDVCIANGLKFDNGICTGEPDIKIPIDGKREAMRRLLESYRFPRNKIVVLGDSRGDIPMMEMAGFSIAVAATHGDVINEADVSVDGNNLGIISELVEEYLTGEELRKPRYR
ncbi:HAD-IB family phosphatase [bacterium]|nr:HAD-IB family phosphatase [bacterium]